MHNRLLSRTVTAAGAAGVCIEGVFYQLADEVFLAVDAVQVDVMQDAGAVPGPCGDLGGRAAGAGGCHPPGDRGLIAADLFSAASVAFGLALGS